MKITMLTRQRSMLGYHWHASEMAFKFQFAGQPFRVYITVLSICTCKSTREYVSVQKCTIIDVGIASELLCKLQN